MRTKRTTLPAALHYLDEADVHSPYDGPNDACEYLEDHYDVLRRRSLPVRAVVYTPNLEP